MATASTEQPVLSLQEMVQKVKSTRADLISPTWVELNQIYQSEENINHVKTVLGKDLYRRIKNAKVLMVGAGGIGCELLKNLLMSKFMDVHIVDLDTIDLSNLNRQFLFRHEHIKQSKALVAKTMAQRFNPEANITAYHANIKDDKFTVKWFSQFDIVFNALDNLDARRYVNRMCLTANVPLIESGTTGFNGQVQVIKRRETACYDCSPKETPKTFPVCTIRSTPSQPIHCIVWAKNYLLQEIYGESEDASAFDHSQDAKNAAEIEELHKESQALKRLRALVKQNALVPLLFEKVFKTDIERLMSMDQMWKGKRKPVPLDYVQLKQDSDKAVEGMVLAPPHQRPWTLGENLAMLGLSMAKFRSRLLAETSTNPHDLAIHFDKDDEDTLNFVTAASNIRAHIFGIDMKSRFDVKQMAGNIIPAIATTNAITAGVVILQAYQILQVPPGSVKEVFLTPFAPDRLLAPDVPRPVNPDCRVCVPQSFAIEGDLEYISLLRFDF